MSPRRPDTDRPSWTGPRPFVGRDAVTDELLAATDGAAEAGRAVFLLGEAGSGKTALLGVFEELAFRRHAGLQTGYAECATDDRGEPAWPRLEQHFTHAVRMRRAAISLLPDWIQVVPLIGPIVAAAIHTVQRLRGRSIRRRRPAARAGEPSVVDRVRSLAEHAKDQPCLVILDQVERAGPDDLAGASALIRRLEESRIVFVIAVRTVNGRPTGPARDLLLEAERLGRTSQVRLPDFDRDELLEVVSLIVRGMIPPQWLDWLAAESAGRPGPLWDALGVLERAGQLRKAGKTWEFHGDPPAPDGEDAAAAAAEIAGPIDDETRRLLSLAAVEGETFHSAVLADLAGIGELDVEDRLAPLVRAGILEHRGEHDLGSELTSRYAFRSARDARTFAALLAPDERAALEARAADVRRAFGAASAG